MNKIGRAQHTTKWLLVSELGVKWEDAQRTYDPKWAQAIATDLDPDMFGVLSVCPVNGGDFRYHLIDGRHRRNAVEILWGTDQKVPCNVFEADTAERAAQIFNTLNTSRKNPKSLDIFKTRVTGKVEPELSVSKIIKESGWHWGSGVMDATLHATGACIHTYKHYGDDTLRRTLHTITTIFGKPYEAMNAQLVRGFALFLARYGEHIDWNHFTKRIQKDYTPNRLRGRAKALNEGYRDGLPANVCRALFMSYNQGMRKNKLEE